MYGLHASVCVEKKLQKSQKKMSAETAAVCLGVQRGLCEGDE